MKTKKKSKDALFNEHQSYGALLKKYQQRFLTTYGYLPLESTDLGYHALSEQQREESAIFWGLGQVQAARLLSETFFSLYAERRGK